MSILNTLSRRHSSWSRARGACGKTTVSAVLGRALAAAGRRTIVVEVDPREKPPPVFALPPSGAPSWRPALASGCRTSRPRQVRTSRPRAHAAGIAHPAGLDSSIYQHFSAAAPGLKEVAILGHAWRLLNGLGGMARLSSTRSSSTLPLPAWDQPARRAAFWSPRSSARVPFADIGQRAGQVHIRPGTLRHRGSSPRPRECRCRRRSSFAIPALKRVQRDAEALIVNGPVPSGPSRRRLRQRAGLALAPAPEAERGEMARLTADWEGPRIELPLLAMDRGPL